jgi:starch synthase (maltosyl-transferring)
VRIDFVITELFVGGAERCLTEIACGLASRGDDVRVFSLAPLPSGEQRALVTRLQDRGVQVVSGDAAGVRSIVRAKRKLSQFLKESPPDVCQSFLFHANVLTAMANKNKKHSSKFVGGIRVAEDRWVRNQIERMAVQRMDGLVCVSESVRQFAIKELAASSEIAITISNAVDVARFESVSGGDVFCPTSLGWPESCEVILFIGRMHSQKGIDLIQRQVDQLIPIDSNRKLILVGDGPLAESIDAWCDLVGRDRVRRLPWQSDVVPLIHRCQMLLLPSRYEGMPNVVMEAMAAGRPVACSRVEGIAELLGNDPQQSFDTGDEAKMVQLVNRLFDQPKIAAAIGATNQAKMRQEFSVPAMVNAYRDYYERLIHREDRTDR